MPSTSNSTPTSLRDQINAVTLASPEWQLANVLTNLGVKHSKSSQPDMQALLETIKECFLDGVLEEEADSIIYALMAHGYIFPES